MLSKTIKTRIEQLERMLPPESMCIVRDENGKEKEVAVKELIKNIDRWQLVHMVNCSLPELDELLNAAWEAAQDETKYPAAAE